MNDTNPEMQDNFNAMVMRRSPGERLMMGCAMFDTAKSIVISSLCEKTKGLQTHEMKKEIFLRFYGLEFNDHQKKKILEAFNVVEKSKDKE